MQDVHLRLGRVRVDLDFVYPGGSADQLQVADTERERRHIKNVLHTRLIKRTPFQYQLVHLRCHKLQILQGVLLVPRVQGSDAGRKPFEMPKISHQLEHGQACVRVKPWQIERL